jgi:hypothetical protein
MSDIIEDAFLNFLGKVAHYKQLDYNYRPEDQREWLIKVNDTINSTLLTLDMRFHTYAEGSWTRTVFKNAMSETVSKCDCDDCNKWKMRLFQMCEEIEYAISCLIHKEGETND